MKQFLEPSSSFSFSSAVWSALDGGRILPEETVRVLD